MLKLVFWRQFDASFRVRGPPCPWLLPHTHTVTAGCPPLYRVCMLSVGPSPAPSKLLGSSSCRPGGALVCWIRHRPGETTRHGSLTTGNIPFLTLWALKWIWMVFKATQLRKQCVCTANTGWLLLFCEIIAVYSHNYSKHKMGCFNVKVRHLLLRCVI